MRFRCLVLAIAAACGMTTTVRAADPAPVNLDKFLPDVGNIYVHANLQQFLAAPVVRKAIPMAVDKYAKEIAGFAQMAMQMNPNAGNVSEDQIKGMLEQLKDPAVIAQAFDAAKDAVTDVIFTGSHEGPNKMLLLIKCSDQVQPDMVKALAPMLKQVPQIKLETHEKGDKTIFEISAQGQSFFVAVPEAGVIAFSLSKDLIEKSVKGGNSGPSADMKKLIAKRAKNDFLFVAAGKQDEIESAVARLVLNQDINGDMSVTYTSADKAKEEAEQANKKLGEFANQLKSMLGGQAKEVAPVLEKMKAKADGKTVTGTLAIPGAVVEKLLAKEKN